MLIHPPPPVGRLAGPKGPDADGGVGTTQVSGIVVVDPHTLVVRLAGPCTYFLDLLAFPPFYSVA